MYPVIGQKFLPTVDQNLWCHAVNSERDRVNLLKGPDWLRMHYDPGKVGPLGVAGELATYRSFGRDPAPIADPTPRSLRDGTDRGDIDVAGLVIDAKARNLWGDGFLADIAMVPERKLVPSSPIDVYAFWRLLRDRRTLEFMGFATSGMMRDGRPTDVVDKRHCPTRELLMEELLDWHTVRGIAAMERAVTNGSRLPQFVG